jgi:citrate synthase
MAYEYVPGLADVPCAQSKICDIDGERGILEYRGYNIEDLAEHSTFEETAYLLLFGRLPVRSELEKFSSDLLHHRRLKYKIIDLIKCLPEAGHPMEALQAAVAALGMFYDGNEVEERDERYWSAVRLIAKLPTITAAFHRLRRGDDAIQPRDDLSHSANFLYMLTEQVPDKQAERVLDICLILHAEHSMNASTFSGRVTASTLADPYTVISSAIGTLRGPLHGGANERVIAMLREIGDPERAKPHIDKMLAAKDKVMGFGHRIYKVKDPRANILQKLAADLADKRGGTKIYQTAMRVEQTMKEAVGGKGIAPNVDFFSGIVYEAMGFPPDLFTPIFAIARVAGWLAHWLEQLEDNKIFRPGQIYTGAHKQKYAPLSDRG